jgi:hypothetical protein
MNPTASTILSASVSTSDFLLRNLWWLLPAAIVVVGLLVFGLKDLLRFSVARTWAISSVCFAESIRKRTLWVTPLAIVGVIIVSQFQKPVDELDAIRQTTKFCLFATGMLVTLTAILLACTNLPKEIENRVIFTIVTKPTTRLEIVLGKVLGFARVSGAILLIMGLFTFGYLHLRAYGMQREIRQRLADGKVEEAIRPTFEHYATAGLLNAKEYYTASDLGFFSRVPELNSPMRWTSAAASQMVLIPLEIPTALLPESPEDAQASGASIQVLVDMKAEKTCGETKTEDAQATTKPRSKSRIFRAKSPAPAPGATPPDRPRSSRGLRPRLFLDRQHARASITAGRSAVARRQADHGRNSVQVLPDPAEAGRRGTTGPSADSASRRDAGI